MPSTNALLFCAGLALAPSSAFAQVRIGAGAAPTLTPSLYGLGTGPSPILSPSLYAPGAGLASLSIALLSPSPVALPEPGKKGPSPLCERNQDEDCIQVIRAHHQAADCAPVDSDVDRDRIAELG